MILLDRVSTTIEPLDREIARRSLARALDREDASALAETIRQHKRAHAMLEGVFASSPHLAALAAKDPARLARLLTTDPDARLDALVAEARALQSDNLADVMRRLRLIKQESALLIGVADLSKAWDTIDVTRALTRVADATLSAAVRFSLREAARARKIDLADADAPETRSGWILLAMGKQGAFELNYSSDIDIVVLFDRSRARVADPSEDINCFVSMTQRVVKIMSERTADGYVFRVDLRLRPDPGATPIAIPLQAAYSYYESVGQNWERAAFIKARPVAGDIEAATMFLNDLTPFIWRKYLDFAAIADIHSIKRQIHAYKGHGVVSVHGHDVKLGRGGIREIEFFVQTQQLILGGVDARLRGRSTLDMLDQLLDAGWIKPDARDELRRAYLFLRDLEHRIQMVDDQQRHTLPQDDASLAAIARMMNFSTLAEFVDALLDHLTKVQAHYAALFETAPQLSSSAGSLVFTGAEDDPATLETLQSLGYHDVRMVAETVRGWHVGRYPAMHSSVARERLTELTPALLEALADTGSGDAALLAFDRLLSKLPAGVQLFSLLVAHPELLNLLAMILGGAPALADTISRRPRVFGVLLEPSFFAQPPSELDYMERCAAVIGGASSYQDALDQARIYGQEQKFLIGVHILAGVASVEDAGRCYAALAQAIIVKLLERVTAEFARAYGEITGGSVAVVAMGRLGGREMTAASDLDLMLLYDCAPLADSSGGERSLMAPDYYARLTQRLITALSAPTAQGQLYEVDFRLRPSGNKGPIALRLAGFEDYQANEAWTWEHMALTRARVVAGEPILAARIAQTIRSVLTSPRDAEKLRHDILDMRARVEKEKGSSNPWSLKQARGGLLDIEFLTQYLLLRHACAHPDCLSQNTGLALERLRDLGLLGSAEAEALIDAWRFYQGLSQILRLALDDEFSPDTAPRGLVEALQRQSGAPDLSHLEAALNDRQARTRAIFSALLEHPSGQ